MNAACASEIDANLLFRENQKMLLKLYKRTDPEVLGRCSAAARGVPLGRGVVPCLTW